MIILATALFIALVAVVVAWRRSHDRAALQAVTADALRADLKAILSSLSSGLLLVDEKGVVRTASRSAARILFRERDEILGRDVNEAFDEGWHAFKRCLMQALVREETVEREEIVIHRPDGVSVPIGVTVNPVYGAHGELTGAAAVFQDLSDVVRMRDRMREADRLAAVGELAASIAHEIRNPLGSIRGSAEILGAELDVDGAEARLLDLILKESGRVNHLIEDFLGFARLRPSHPELVVLSEVLAEVTAQADVDPSVPDDVAVTSRVAPDDLVLMVDQEQFRQVLLNLVQNAAAFLGDGGRIHLEAGLDPDCSVCLVSVRDTGPGLPSELADRIFQPFVTTRKEGTGLGLATVRRIIHAHGGAIDAADHPDGGAIFTIQLPLVHGDSCLTRDEALAEASAACVLT